jgi:tetratricopeptide (TPR) repeat protein
VTSSPTTKSRRLLEYPRLVSALLALSVFAVYLPVTQCDFVNYDDNEYVTNNPKVTAGLTWDGIKWAFTHSHSANWHPLTWLSHMLDCQLYGLHPAGHHLTNLLFHAANTVLLFLFLRYLTGAFWRSAAVAAFFGLHPLHVESVAWVSERKDVLSAFFGILCLWAYARYAKGKAEVTSRQPESRIKNPGSRIQDPGSNPTIQQSNNPLFYVAALLALALGLMSKPMLVTWPFVMLLLDFWPLGRLKLSRLKSQLPILLEKLPFFALAALSCLVTVKAQHGAIVPMDVEPLGFRFANTLMSYVCYIGKLFWPSHLAVIYVHMHEWPFGAIVAAALILITVTAVIAVQAKARPYLLLGWAWFLGTLIPVIGLLQVGNQSMADRYMYLPAIGAMLAIIWLTASKVGGQEKRPYVAAGCAGCLLTACALVAGAQMLTWQTSETLFRQALAVNKDNFVAWNNLGNFYSSLTDEKPAAYCFTNAILSNPGYQRPYNGLGCVLNNQKRYAEAVPLFEAALKLNPKFVDAHNNLGFALQNMGKTNEAIACYQAALSLDPNHVQAHGNLANVLIILNQFEEAKEHYEALLRQEPKDPFVRGMMARLLMREGKTGEAIKVYESALVHSPDSTLLRVGFGDALLETGDTTRAFEQYSQALKSKPEDAEAHYHLALALSRQGDIKQAVEHYRLGLKAFASAAEPLNNLAWILATNPDPAIRNGAEAVRLSERACQLTENKEAMLVGTLAAAYAEAGRFDDAISTAEKAKVLAEKSNQPEVATKNAQLLELYRAGKAYRDVASAN